MTKFLYIADTHLGAVTTGYQQQSAHPLQLKQILSALGKLAVDSYGVDFIIHGGDMTHTASSENIAAAATAFDIGVPLYLCLGNHDLDDPEALMTWQTTAPQFFRHNSPDYSIECADCVIHIFPNQWGERLYYWGDTQTPYFSKLQIEQLTQALAGNSRLPHFLVTHAPVHGLPPAQTGLDEPYHAPPPSFTGEIMALATKHPQLRCVLGAHNHMNMRLNVNGAEFVTASSLIETPFECKLFAVSATEISMTTLSLQGALNFADDYNPERKFVQGRDIDRTFTLKLEEKQDESECDKQQE